MAMALDWSLRLDIPNEHDKRGYEAACYEVVPARALDLGWQGRHQLKMELHPRNARECERKYKDQTPDPHLKRKDPCSSKGEEQ